MMKDPLYHFIVGVIDLFVWSGELLDKENLPKSGPAVFIGNHLDAAGPVGTACSIPLRIHPWVMAEMVDKDLAPVYLQGDFTERQLQLKPPLSLWVAKVLCWIAVPLFHSFGVIPVYRGDYERLHETMQTSLDLLKEGKFVLVFPEDNRLPTDPVTKMQPFQHSFVRLAEMYHAETGLRLPFIPVATHASGYVRIGKQVVHNPLNSVGMERRRLKDTLEQEIIRMYLEMDGQGPDKDVRALTPVR
jgi:hypothetical protein